MGRELMTVRLQLDVQTRCNDRMVTFREIHIKQEPVDERVLALAAGVTAGDIDKDRAKGWEKGLDPLVLVYLEERFDSTEGTGSYVCRTLYRFDLETYEPVSKTATYKPYALQRSDRLYDRLLLAWDFEKQPEVAMNDAEEDRRLVAEVERFFALPEEEVERRLRPGPLGLPGAIGNVGAVEAAAPFRAFDDP